MGTSKGAAEQWAGLGPQELGSVYLAGNRAGWDTVHQFKGFFLEVGFGGRA